MVVLDDEPDVVSREDLTEDILDRTVFHIDRDGSVHVDISSVDNNGIITFTVQSGDSLPDRDVLQIQCYVLRESAGA